MKSMLILLLVFTIGFIHAGDDQRAAIIKVKLLNARLELFKAQGIVEASKTEAPEIVSISYKKAVELKKAVEAAQKAVDELPTPDSILEKNQELLKEYEANRDILRKVEIDYKVTRDTYNKKRSALHSMQDSYQRNMAVIEEYDKKTAEAVKQKEDQNKKNPLSSLVAKKKIAEKEFEAADNEYKKELAKVQGWKEERGMTSEEYMNLLRPFSAKRRIAQNKVIALEKQIYKYNEKVVVYEGFYAVKVARESAAKNKKELEPLLKDFEEYSKKYNAVKEKYDAASKMVEGGRPETSIYKLRAKYDREIKPLRKKLWDAQKAYERFPNADRLIASTHSRLAREEKADSAELKAAKEKVAAYTKRVQELEAELAKIEGKPEKQTEQSDDMNKDEKQIPNSSEKAASEKKPDVEITVNKKDTPEKPVNAEGDDGEF